jgi:SecD/SecF fusion protein
MEVIVILLTGFVLPFVLGHYVAQALRMKKHAARFSLVFLTTILSLLPFAYQSYKGQPLNQAVKLGIDLAGGTNLVYQVDEPMAKKMEKTVSPQAMELLVTAITRRVNPSGTEEVTVRVVGDDRVEVIVPGAGTGDVDRIKKAITNLGALEFAILAHRGEDAIIVKEAENVEHELRKNSIVVAEWVPVAKNSAGQYKDVETNDDAVFRVKTDTDGKQYLEFLVLKSPEKKRVTGQFLTRAFQTQDGNAGLAVGFHFNNEGAYRFGNLTSEYQPRKDGHKRRLAAILNNSIHSAPSINDVIRDQGIISGRFTSKEINELISVLNAGALELPLKTAPINEFTVSPLLGIDVQEKGLFAMSVSSIAVMAFIIAYYQLPGIIAVICLFLNMIMLMGCMALINATFTLPGLAGIVLTIGMAVDANVLIYERMREELAKGTSFRLAIQNGFEKAWGTIFDSNITTLLTAWILYYIGTEQVKGFAVSLIVGIMTSMFTGVYVCHLLFDVMENARFMKSLKFYNFVGETKFDFVGIRKYAVMASIIFIALGMFALFSRGKANMDIDFTGGSMVTFKFENEPDIDAARKVLSDKFGTNISLERLQVTDPSKKNDPNAKPDIFFRLRTSEGNDQVVSTGVEEAFAKTDFHLTKISVTSGPIGLINAPEVKPGEKKEDVVLDPYTGGHVVDLKFSSEVSTGSVEEMFVDAMDNVIKNEKLETKLDNPLSLIKVTGKAGSGMTSDQQSTKRYSELEVMTKPDIPNDLIEKSLVYLQNKLATSPVFDEVNTFDSAVATDTQLGALKAIFLSLVMIVIYVWFRFENLSFGVGAVIALLHDVLVVLAMLPIAAYLSGTPIGSILMFEDFKINLTIIAAILTVIGYSINDTIVIFDRIREVKGKSPVLTPEMVNLSLNQTLSRTILTTLTVLIVVLIMYLIGGEGIHAFAFCLLVGMISGVYSTVYIASPVVLWISDLQNRKRVVTPTKAISKA